MTLVPFCGGLWKNVSRETWKNAVAGHNSVLRGCFYAEVLGMVMVSTISSSVSSLPQDAPTPA